jgi:hypothetical protein
MKLYNQYIFTAIDIKTDSEKVDIVEEELYNVMY